MKKLLLVSIFIALFSNAAMATQTIKAKVNGMVCAFCAQGIEKKMRKLSQTQDVYVNLKKRMVAVELKEGETLSNKEVTEIINDAGYDVVSIEVSDESIAQVKSVLEAR
ncbi:MAG: heavy metal transporter [Methylophilaceae bacterium]|nr:MAG: heavy metal transporter [Methylophilaceae bacterium]